MEILTRISHWTRSVSKNLVIGPVQQTQNYYEYIEKNILSNISSFLSLSDEIC